MGFIVKNGRKWVVKDSRGFLERNTMFSQIGCCLLIIPLEALCPFRASQKAQVQAVTDHRVGGNSAKLSPEQIRDLSNKLRIYHSWCCETRHRAP